MSKYVNFGDVNFMENDGFWIARDDEIIGSACYYIVTLDRLEDSEEFKYLVSNGYIDLSDNWFDTQSVYSSYDIEENSSDADKVKALVSYYGINDFCGQITRLSSTLEAIEYLESYDIDVPQSSEEYKKDVESKVFDIKNDKELSLNLPMDLEDLDKVFLTDREREVGKILLSITTKELCEKFKYDYEKIEEHLDNL
jgi:hypothetical protein